MAYQFQANDALVELTDTALVIKGDDATTAIPRDKVTAIDLAFDDGVPTGIVTIHAAHPDASGPELTYRLEVWADGRERVEDLVRAMKVPRHAGESAKAPGSPTSYSEVMGLRRANAPSNGTERPATSPPLSQVPSEPDGWDMPNGWDGTDAGTVSEPRPARWWGLLAACCAAAMAIGIGGTWVVMREDNDRTILEQQQTIQQLNSDYEALRQTNDQLNARLQTDEDTGNAPNCVITDEYNEATAE
ncbi:MAG: hypothetical protein UHD09_01785 [Bifidobacterium sp.]|nr:hypothetical protein [Bifidobacterium sp.]